MRRRFFKEREEEVDSLLEGDVVLGHNEIDRVEVFVAAEAPCKVGMGVGCGIELVAKWAHESEESFREFPWQVKQVSDDEVNGDVISKEEKGLSWDGFGHDKFLFG